MPIVVQAAEREPWWNVPASRSAIALTAQQVEQLDTIYRESLPRRRTLRHQLAAQQKRVEEMLSTGSFTEEEVHPVVDRLFALDKERNVARVLMLIRMYRVLTPSQQIKLQHLSAKASEDRLRRPFVGLLSGVD